MSLEVIAELVSSSFYGNLTSIMYDILPEEKVIMDYVDARMENVEDYSIDYYIQVKNNEPLYVFGVPNKDKARL